MSRRRNSKQNIQFSNRTHPAGGVASLVLGVCCVVLLFALCMASWTDRGQSGAWIGFMGVVTFAMSVIGFIFAMRCYRMEDVYMVTPTVGAVINGIILVTLMLLYVVGAVS